MIQHTFIHIPGIGKKSEQTMWRQGLTSIEQLAEQMESAIMDEGEETRSARKAREAVECSMQALDKQDWNYFCKALPAREHWRLIPCFKRPAYLDIETTGLGHLENHITTIGVYDGAELVPYIYGRNLDAFIDDIQQYDCLVTYNGKTFDLPFIEQHFHAKINLPHLDLRYMLGALGYKGGLKKIEKTLGLVREGALQDIDGYMAVLLWKEYTNNGNRAALETLIAYNLEDVITLKPLCEKVFNLNLPDMFKHLELRETTEHPQVGYQADGMLVNQLKRYMW